MHSEKPYPSNDVFDAAGAQLNDLLSSQQREILFAQSTELRLGKQQNIVSAGSVSEDIYFLKEGRIAATKSSAKGIDVSIRLIGSGSFFSWSFCFDRRPSAFSYVTQTAVVVRKIPIVTFEKVVADDAELINKLLPIIVGRLELAYSSTAEQLAGQAVTKVANIVYRLVKKFGEASVSGVAINGFSQQDIADLSGLSRPRVSIALAELQQRGFIQIKRSHLLVTDAKALKAYTDN